MVQSCIWLQGRKTIKGNETLCVLVGLRYLAAKELAVLPKSHSLHQFAAVRYWPVCLLPGNQLLHVLRADFLEVPVDRRKMQQWKLQISTRKSFVPSFCISLDSIYDTAGQPGARFLEELSDNIDSFAQWKLKNSRLVCLDVSHIEKFYWKKSNKNECITWN